MPASGVAPGAQLRVTLDSSISAPFVTFVSSPGPVMPLPVGLWIEPSLALPIAFGSMTAGTRLDVINVPVLLPPGLPIGLQTVLLEGQDLRLSTPAVVIRQ